MSYARLKDGTIFHFPTLTGSEGVIDVPPVHELEATVREMVSDSIPLFVKSMTSGILKRRHAARYAKVNYARLILARACIERMIAETPREARGEPTSQDEARAALWREFIEWRTDYAIAWRKAGSLIAAQEESGGADLRAARMALDIFVRSLVDRVCIAEAHQEPRKPANPAEEVARALAADLGSDT